MFCGKCGKRLTDGNIFCTGCGAIIVREEPAAAQPPVKAVALAAPPVAAESPSTTAEFVPVYADETTPAEPELSPEEAARVKKNLTVHAAVFAGVAALLVVSLLVFNPMRVRYEVLRDGYGQAMTNPLGQEITVTQGAASPWGVFTQPAPYRPDSTTPTDFTQPGQDYPNGPSGNEPDVTQQPDVGPELSQGIALFNAQQFPQAVQRFNAVLATDPENFAALAHRGMANFNLNNFHDAITDLTAAHRQSPDNAEVLVWRGASFFSIGFHAEAVSDLTAALQTNPANPTALEFRGRAFEAMGNHAAAVADAESAAALRGVAMQ
ncbi:MAG: tetratricopeptide repeat protein [Oscillospiraceae bacterium]|nr:tetratricopeptide repeat protein [Oscillospiraceae bacterium]